MANSTIFKWEHDVVHHSPPPFTISQTLPEALLGMTSSTFLKLKIIIHPTPPLSVVSSTKLNSAIAVLYV